MRSNTQSIPPLASPKIDGTEQQGTLPVGPTGVVHRGGGTVPWAKRCALTLTPSPSSKLLFMVLASYVNGPDKAAWPSQTTLAEMTGLTARGVRNATKQLEAAGLVRVEQGGGDKSIRYWLTPELSAPLPRNSVPPPPEVSSPEVLREGTSTSTREAAALLPVPDQEGVDEKPQAETEPRNRSVTTLARHTCPTCGNSWPSEYGKTCYVCPAKKKNRGVYVAGGAAPVPGKYDGLYDPPAANAAHTGRIHNETGGQKAPTAANAAPRPDQAPMKPKLRRDLEADARAKGYIPVGGKWVKTRLRRYRS